MPLACSSVRHSRRWAMSDRKHKRGAGDDDDVGRSGSDVANLLQGRLRAALPPDWRMSTLGQLSLGLGRYGSPVAAQPWRLDWPRYVRITDIDDNGRLRPDGRASIAPTLAEKFLLSPGDLLFARSGATVGKTYLYREEDGLCAHAGYIIRFAVDAAQCDPAFVAWWTRGKFYANWVRSHLRQGAQPNINATEFASLPVPLPPLAEQRAIVAALDSGDHLLRSSREIVDKLRQALRALVNDLLSTGIVRGVRQRRDPKREPEAFCDTEIGPMPRAFRIQPLQALLSKEVTPAMRSGPFGSELRKSDLASEGIPVLGIDNVETDRFVPRYRRFVTREKFRALARYAVRPNDVVVTIMGTVGRCCLIPEDIGEALSSKHIWTMSFDREQCLPDLIALQINYADWVRSQFQRWAQGGTMSALQSKTLRETLVAVPSIMEQHCIADVLSSARRRVMAECDALDKQRQICDALREDLLNGRRRLKA